jgi:hypothetical protein
VVFLSDVRRFRIGRIRPVVRSRIGHIRPKDLARFVE